MSILEKTLLVLLYNAFTLNLTLVSLTRGLFLFKIQEFLNKELLIKKIIFILSFLFISSLSSATEINKDKVCLKFTIKSTKWFIYKSERSAFNCKGNMKLEEVSPGSGKYQFLSSFKFTDFVTKNAKSQKSIIDTFKGDWQKLLYYHTDPKSLSTWKDLKDNKNNRGSDGKLPTNGKLVVAGKSFTVNGKIKFTSGLSHNTIETTFSYLSTDLPTSQSIFEKIDDYIRIEFFAPTKKIEGGELLH